MQLKPPMSTSAAAIDAALKQETNWLHAEGEILVAAGVCSILV